MGWGERNRKFCISESKSSMVGMLDLDGGVWGWFIGLHNWYLSHFYPVLPLKNSKQHAFYPRCNLGNQLRQRKELAQGHSVRLKNEWGCEHSNLTLQPQHRPSSQILCSAAKLTGWPLACACISAKPTSQGSCEAEMGEGGALNKAPCRTKSGIKLT